MQAGAKGTSKIHHDTENAARQSRNAVRFGLWSHENGRKDAWIFLGENAPIKKRQKKFKKTIDALGKGGRVATLFETKN